MRMLRRLAVSFSIYSRIPMPVFEWTSDDMKYNLVFLPGVGIVIGVAEYILWYFMQLINIPATAQLAFMSAIPLLITGGFHVDGFMDTMDAVRSYKSCEDKLKILKDPHIGAFSVICIITYICVWTGMLSIMINCEERIYIILFAAVFFMARCMTGIMSLTVRKAKKEGMLVNETSNSGRKEIIALAIQAIIGAVFFALSDVWVFIICVCFVAIFSAYYVKSSIKNFGGVTGDTAGYYTVMVELVMLTAIVIGTYL